MEEVRTVFRRAVTVKPPSRHTTRKSEYVFAIYLYPMLLDSTANIPQLRRSSSVLPLSQSRNLIEALDFVLLTADSACRTIPRLGTCLDGLNLRIEAMQLDSRRSISNRATPVVRIHCESMLTTSKS